MFPHAFLKASTTIIFLLFVILTILFYLLVPHHNQLVKFWKLLGHLECRRTIHQDQPVISLPTRSFHGFFYLFGHRHTSRRLSSTIGFTLFRFLHPQVLPKYPSRSTWHFLANKELPRTFSPLWWTRPTHIPVCIPSLSYCLYPECGPIFFPRSSLFPSGLYLPAGLLLIIYARKSESTRHNTPGTVHPFAVHFLI